MEFNNPCQYFAYISHPPVSTKGCSGFFLFCLDLELFAKIEEKPGSYTLNKPGLSITQDLNKIKKS